MTDPHGCGLRGAGLAGDEYSRARAAMSLVATVQSRMAKAQVARVMEIVTDAGVHF
jgi:hypothetical protein